MSHDKGILSVYRAVSILRCPKSTTVYLLNRKFYDDMFSYVSLNEKNQTIYLLLDRIVFEELYANSNLKFYISIYHIVFKRLNMSSLKDFYR